MHGRVIIGHVVFFFFIGKQEWQPQFDLGHDKSVRDFAKHYTESLPGEGNQKHYTVKEKTSSDKDTDSLIWASNSRKGQRAQS